VGPRSWPSARDNRVPLEEVAIDGGCAYVTTVGDGFEVYSIEASHPDSGVGGGSTNSNPACSYGTDPEDTDAVIEMFVPTEPVARAGQPIDRRVEGIERTADAG
jgi:hypothetical protein